MLKLNAQLIEKTLIFNQQKRFTSAAYPIAFPDHRSKHFKNKFVRDRQVIPDSNKKKPHTPNCLPKNLPVIKMKKYIKTENTELNITYQRFSLGLAKP